MTTVIVIFAVLYKPSRRSVTVFVSVSIPFQRRLPATASAAAAAAVILRVIDHQNIGKPCFT